MTQALEVEEAAIEGSFLHNYRYTPAPAYNLLGGHSNSKEHWTHQLALTLNFVIAESRNYKLYWHNEVEGQSTNKRFRRIHYDFEWGVQTGNHVQFFWHHRSEHLMDTFLDDYPLKDAIGFRIFLKR
jgi:hypothetical protein